MEDRFVWMTTRQIEPGTLTDFERAWRPDTHPEGMLRPTRTGLRTSGKSSGSRSGSHGSRATRGGAPKRKRTAVRRWPATSWGSRKRSTEAASCTCQITRSTPGPAPARS